MPQSSSKNEPKNKKWDYRLSDKFGLKKGRKEEK